jgi:ubiquinone/menaquinone biosynthesis C-methylase UbiE
VSGEFQRWQRRTHIPAQSRRTAERNAGFFLPHLTPGMQVLDVGCGPGSISVGLGEAVGADGTVTGVDISREAIAAADQLDGRVNVNVRFVVADLYQMPFPDGAFDAAFCHAVLQHLSDPHGALREMRRVMRPGAVIGVADADHDGSILSPSDPALEASLRLLRELRERTGGDTGVGKKLRGLLNEAGFERVSASVTADADGDAEATGRTGRFWGAYFRSPELREQAKTFGLASEEELDAMSDAWLRWGESPGAFWARFWCQAVGWAPDAL